MPEGKKVLVIVLILLFGGLYSCAQTFHKEMHEKSSGGAKYLFDIARGDMSNILLQSQPHFDWERPAPKTISNKPSCSRYTHKGDEGNIRHDASYNFCTYISTWAGPGCAWWRFEACDVYAADDFILTEPDLMGRIVHVLQAPCLYLPTAQEMQDADKEGVYVPRQLRQGYAEYACGKGGRAYPEDVTINIRDDHGGVIAQYRHIPPQE